MKIRVIIPIVGTQFNAGIREEIETVRAPDCEIDYVNLDKGTMTISSRCEEAINTPDIIRLARQAEKDGVDGIFIDCFGEPGVSVVRELVDIPVVGGFEGAALTACLVAQRFSIVTVTRGVVPMIHSLVRELGLERNLASIRDVGIPPSDLGDMDLLIQHLVEQSTAAVRMDGAEAILLGCTGMLQVTKTLRDTLARDGIPAQVISPTTATVGMLQSIIRNGLTQSRLTYVPPSPEILERDL